MIQSGEHEGLKAGVHAGLCGLALVCFGYNALAWLVRGESHLARNSIIYGGLVAYELFKVSHHLKNRGPDHVDRTHA